MISYRDLDTHVYIIICLWNSVILTCRDPNKTKHPKQAAEREREREQQKQVTAQEFRPTPPLTDSVNMNVCDCSNWAQQHWP